MKIDRLMAILTILLRQEKITAPELADRLEVSRRTISRDLDVLCQAGIPVVTEQGYGGGISLSPGFKIDASLLTEKERDALLTGIRGLDSVMTAPLAEGLREKLRMLPRKDTQAQETVNIDLASYYKNGHPGTPACFLYLLLPQRGGQAAGGAIPNRFSVVLLVSARLLPGEGRLPSVQAEPAVGGGVPGGDLFPADCA